MANRNSRSEPTEVPATFDRDVEDNSFDWQRAGGDADAKASDKAGQAAGAGGSADSPPTGGRAAKGSTRPSAQQSHPKAKNATKHASQPEPAEVPATFDRDVEDNSADWQRAGGSSGGEASDAAGQTAGEPSASSPVQPVPDTKP